MIKLGYLKPGDGEKQTICGNKLLSCKSWVTVKSDESSVVGLGDETEIPLEVESKANYEYLGFNNQRSQHFWEFWMKMPDDHKPPNGPKSFDMINIHHITEYGEDAVDVGTDRRGIMQSWRVAPWMIGIIPNPEFDVLLLIESAKSWMLPAIRYSFEGLVDA